MDKLNQFESTELCSHCESEQIVTTILQECPNPECKKPLVACSMCVMAKCDKCELGSQFKLAELGTYNIEVCRIGYSFKTITVDATSREEAEDNALDEAGGYEFSEKSSDYVLPDATNDKEELTSEKQELIDKVIEDLKKGFSCGDYTVLDEILTFVPTNILKGSLPEEDIS